MSGDRAASDPPVNADRYKGNDIDADGDGVVDTAADSDTLDGKEADELAGVRSERLLTSTGSETTDGLHTWTDSFGEIYGGIFSNESAGQNNPPVRFEADDSDGNTHVLVTVPVDSTLVAFFDNPPVTVTEVRAVDDDGTGYTFNAGGYLFE